MSHTQGDESDPDVVGVGEPKDPKMKAQDRGSQRTGKASMSLKMSQGASSGRFNNINREETEPEGVLELKDAIIELYLAIKIRSTEEVSLIVFKSAIRQLQIKMKGVKGSEASEKLLEFVTIFEINIARSNNR